MTKHFGLYSILICAAMFAQNAFADTDLSESVKYKESVLKTLKDEIQQIDSEMARCNKQKNGWVAATVVGGVGVAATSTAAIVQAVKINEKKSELMEYQKADKK